MNNTNPPALEVRNLGKSFGKTEVLRGISFTLERGAVLALIGSSGGGKTTLLRCLNFLETADAGQIYVAGSCIFDASESVRRRRREAEVRAARRHFGLVFQPCQLRVKRRGRLVKQHDIRVHRKRSRDRDTLLLPAG
mgnify:CR=1 FL=1